MVVGSPGVGGTSNSSSSSGASWRSGTPSPPLSDEGAPTTGSLWPTSAHSSHNQQHYPYNVSGSSSSSTPGSITTLDEGIVPDYLEEQHPRKKKVSSNLTEWRVFSYRSIDRGRSFVLIVRDNDDCRKRSLANPDELGLRTAQGIILSFYCRAKQVLDSSFYGRVIFCFIVEG